MTIAIPTNSQPRRMDLQNLVLNTILHESEIVEGNYYRIRIEKIPPF